jgi:hypothetical protein
MAYTFALLETFDDGRLEEVDQECWDTMRMVKAIRDYRKFKVTK